MLALAVVGSGCTSEPGGAESGTTATVVATSEPSVVATEASPAVVATSEPTATRGPPMATTLVDLDVWPDPLYDGTPLRSLERGETVEVDARRYGCVRLVDGGLDVRVSGRARVVVHPRGVA